MQKILFLNASKCLKKAIFLSLLFLTASMILSSCAASLSSAGSKIQTVTENQRDCCCEFIAVITASEEFGITTGMEARSAMNKARNRVAEVGGNAMRIIDVDSGLWGSTVVAEALKCDFSKMNDLKNR